MNATRVDPDRVPPHSIEAEQAVLGGLMLAPESFAKIGDWLGEDDFYRADHRLIFRSIAALIEKGMPVDPVTMGEWFEAQALSQQIGGVAYLIEVTNATCSAANITAYAEIVAEKSKLRKAIDAGTALANAALSQGAESGRVIADAVHTLAQLQTSKLRAGLQQSKVLLKHWFTDLHRRYESGDRITGIPTPWHDLNEITHGLQPGELTVIAARPNMGKSVMGGQLAVFCALRGIRTALFSLEMTSAQVMRRAVSAVGDVKHDVLLAPAGCDESVWPRIMAATEKLTGAALLVDDSPALTIEQIVARARRAHMQSPLGMIVIDHIHECAIDGQNAAYELGRVAQGAKSLGKEFGCPVVALAQLNRANKERADKRPTMTDLRASGEIEQKADLILFLHREDYYNPDTHLQGVVEVDIGKGRDIKTGTRIYLANRYDVMRLDDWDGPLPQAPKVTPHRRGFRTFAERTEDAA